MVLLGLSCEHTTNNSHFQSEHRVNDIDPEEIEDLLNELEDYSDYGPDLDTASVGSTPKPSLRPFFSSSRSLIRDTLDKPPYSIMEKPELGSDHLSDDSSKGSQLVSRSCSCASCQFPLKHKTSKLNWTRCGLHSQLHHERGAKVRGD